VQVALQQNEHGGGKVYGESVQKAFGCCVPHQLVEGLVIIRSLGMKAKGRSGQFTGVDRQNWTGVERVPKGGAAVRGKSRVGRVPFHFREERDEPHGLLVVQGLDAGREVGRHGECEEIGFAQAP